MALSNTFKPGFNNLPSYEVSGVPYVENITLGSGASGYISFPFVTNFLHFNTNSSNTDRIVKVGFTPNSIANGRYFSTSRLIANADGIVDPIFRYRCNEIYLKNDSPGAVQICVIAGLTNIPSSSYPPSYEAEVYGL